jgi:hypothetical protein
MESRLGGFEVAIYEANSSVSGSVMNGTVPSDIPDLISTVGDCRLLKRRNLICVEPCESNQTCSESLSCIPSPLGQDLGTVVVRGLEEYVSMLPVVPGNLYFDTILPHPVVQPGNAVFLKTGDGYIGVVRMYGIGVEQLVLTDEQWLIENNKPLSIHWTAPTEAARSRLFISFNIDQHGISPGRIECDFEDDGEAEIPLQLINQLRGLGISGFPNGMATRRTIDSVSVEDGCVDFAVMSPKAAKVRVAGYTPCNTDFDCPNHDCNETIGLCR